MKTEKIEASKVLSLYKNAKLSCSKEDEIRKKCFEYVNSRVDGELGQWKNDLRQKLLSQERPPISFNIIKKFVNRICGSQAGTKLDEKAFPRDGDSDPALASVLTDLIKYVKDYNDADTSISRMFRDGIIGAAGYYKTEWSNDDDPLGEIRMYSINPSRVYLVGQGEDYDISRDRKGVIEEIPMDKDEILARWPDSSSQIEALSAEFEQFDDESDTPVASTYDYGFGKNVPSDYVYDKDERKLRVLRYQRMVRKNVPFFKDVATGEITQAPEDAPTRKLILELAILQGHNLKEISQSVKSVNISYSIGSVLLEDEVSPYKFSGFDITAFYCYYDNGIITGVVQDLLDAQDEKNKRRSQAIHILGTAAKNGSFITKGFLDDPTKAKREMGTVSPLIEVNGDPRTGIMPMESNMTAVPALINMELMSDADTKSISGLNDASLGIVPQNVTSGRAITALQQPAETIIAEIWTHYLQTRKTIFRKVLSLIQQYYTEERRFRILGDYSSAVLPTEIQAAKRSLIEQMMAASPLLSEEEAIMNANSMIMLSDGSKLITINKQILDKKLNDVTAGRFDVVLDEVSQSVTMRQSQYNEMLNLKAIGVPISDEALIKNSDIRGKQEILQDLDKTRAMQIQMAVMMQGAKSQHATPKQSPQSVDEMSNVGGAQFG